MEKTKVESMHKKTIDESKFKYLDDLNELREEIIKNLYLCENIIDINTVPPPTVGDFMAQTRMNDKRESQHPSAHEGIGGEAVTRRKEVFNNSEFLKWIGAEQIRIKRYIAGGCLQI